MKKGNIDRLALSSKEGKSLIRDAIAEHQREHRGQAVAEVRLILERISLLQRLDKRTQLQLALCGAQLKAIDAGEFEMDDLKGELTFKKADLNVPRDEWGHWIAFAKHLV